MRAEFPRRRSCRSRSTSVLAKARWGWLADKRLADIDAARPRPLERLQKKIAERPAVYELPDRRRPGRAPSRWRSRRSGWRSSATRTKAGRTWDKLVDADREGARPARSGTCWPRPSAGGDCPNGGRRTSRRGRAGQKLVDGELADIGRGRAAVTRADRRRREWIDRAGATAAARSSNCTTTRRPTRSEAVVDRAAQGSSTSIREATAGCRRKSGCSRSSHRRPTSRAAAFERASQVIPGGVNSPARAFGAVGGSPLFIARGRRAVPLRPRRQPLPRLHRLVGADDPRPLPTRRSSRRPSRRSGTGRATAPRASSRRELAELVIEAVPSVEMVRFVSSGTEATMSADPARPRVHRPRPRSSSSPAATTATSIRCSSRPGRAP